MVTYTFTNGTVADADQVNQNFKDVEFIGVLNAQNAYQTLKQSGNFDNKDFLAADKFIDSNGINNTINLTSTNSIFNTNYYELSRNYDLSSHTTVNDGNNINPENFFDFNKNTYAYYKSANNPAARTSSLGKIFPQQYYITTVEIKVQIYIIDHLDSNSTVKLQKYDGNNWIDVTTLINQSSNGTFTYDNIYNFYDYAYGLRIIADTVDFSSTSHERHRFFYFKYYYEYNQNSLVICDSNLLTLDGTEQSLSIYADKDTPENTDISVDISDGTNSITGQPINSVIDISSLSSGNLELTFNLSTTDTLVTPKLYGYGVCILKK